MKVDFVDNEWVKQYCDVEIQSATKRWEDFDRPKNDPYINGSHSGFVQALRNLKNLMETLERLEGKRVNRQ